MKTHSLYKYLLAAVLMLSAVQTIQAQEAFYIYRNDGDFNGFFFDEVKRMGYSKFDLDSIEHDIYVVQEVETADSLYRIPLAAIDSIGFQQPEIKMNPKAKFVSLNGILPYIEYASNDLIRVYDLPKDLFPEPGDILIGLPTDENAKELYSGGSFGFVYDYWQPDKWGDSKRRWLYGHAIENLSDVFEQYITVEDISVDPQGNMARRVAGCDENGIPRRASEGSDGITIFDISGTFSRKWNPTDNSEISLSADVGITHKMRIEYKIGWSLFVKMSRDLIITTKPSIGMSLSQDFEGTIADIIGLPAIMFPASCPIFQTDPVPEIFLRAGGSMSATLKLPAVKLGFGDHIILNTEQLFPVSYGLHWTPETKEPDESMLDLSTDVSMSGYAQTGVKFNADLKTAQWFRKIFTGEIGFYLYCGPKVEAKASVSADLLKNEGINMYDVLGNVNFNVAWLSLDLEAKATAAAFWKDPVSKTFFSKNWSFFTDTLGIVPAFDKTTYDVNGQNVAVTIYPRRTVFSHNHLDIGIYDASNGEHVKTIGGWTYKNFPRKNDPPYTASTSLEPGKYFARPLITWAGKGPYIGPYVYHNDFIIWPDQIQSATISVMHNRSRGGGGGSWSIPVTCSRSGNIYTLSGSSNYEDPNYGDKGDASINVILEIVGDKVRAVGGSATRKGVREKHNGKLKEIWTREDSYSWSDELSGNGGGKKGFSVSNTDCRGLSGYHKERTEWIHYDDEGHIVDTNSQEYQTDVTNEAYNRVTISLYY